MNHPPKIKRGAPLAERFPEQPYIPRADHTASESCGKQAAVSAYCWGAPPRAAVARPFESNIAWRNA